MSPAFRAQMEARRTFERRGLNPVVEDMLARQRQVRDMLRFTRGY
jgi:hypothetical protein